MQSLILLKSSKVDYVQEAKFLDSRHVPDDKLFKGSQFCIEVNPDLNRLDGFLADPYIKLYDTDGVNFMSRVQRFALRNPRLVFHRDKYGAYAVTSRILRDLTSAMEYHTNANGYSGKVIECIDNFLTDLANKNNMLYTKVSEVDFRNVDTSKKNPFKKEGRWC